jgi:integrase
MIQNSSSVFNVNGGKQSYVYPSKGVSVRNNKGTISLRYVYQGKQIDCSLGLDWYDINAHQKAKQIANVLYNDLFIFDTYDQSKAKYQGKKAKKQTTPDTNRDVKDFTLNDSWLLYCEKNPSSSKRDLAEQSRISKILSEETISILDVYKFVELAERNYAPDTIEHDLRKISAAINLAKKFKKHNYENLVSEVKQTLKLKPKKTIRIFTKQELKVILDAFKHNTYCSIKSAYKDDYYYPFVKFRALTGTRPSEAIALTWSDIIEKNGKLWIRINKRYVDGEIKLGTKNGVDIRIFPINIELKELLDNIQKKPHTNLIFPSVENGYINRHNFSKRTWSKIINGLINDGLIKEYLAFYDLRHTFISHMARSGKVDLKTLANICGNSVDTIIKYYLAVDESLELPSLIDD